ncbi:guanine deaminase [Corynebacterium sp. NPDC060344]|uniref:guanine deaminase n=1 Tax=Corynebacterium sp. NPDC060344 TaxID=3347101 RepID=UPI0036686C84
MTRIIRGHVVTPVAGGGDSLTEFPDGAVVTRDGVILAVGEFRDLRADHPDAAVDDHRGRLLVPGFVDCHVHYPQLGMIASPGRELLGWLEDYTFPAELAFADDGHCAAAAEEFCDHLVANGVTTACVYATVHPGSADALFRSAQRRGLRILTGKVCMDCNAPPGLLDTAESAYADSRALLERWHGVDRLEYVITPRFAPTSSEAQLSALGALAAEFPDIAIQTHLSENQGECSWVAELFPGDADYTAVYERHGLVRRRSVFGHAIHLSDGELSRLGAARAALAHCPTSNGFLGSGLFDLARARAVDGLHVGFGSDVGAGTSLSPLATMGEAYKVSRLSGAPLSTADAFRFTTIFAADALGLSDRVGSLEPGKDADVVVLDPLASPILRQRLDGGAGSEVGSPTTEEILFAMMTLGDDRCVARTYVAATLAS